MKVFEALQQIKDGDVVNTYYGICYSVEAILGKKIHDAWDNLQAECFSDWSEFSGSVEYPVPSNEPGVGSVTAFHHTGPNDMWNPKHPYGAARLRLLDHCINWFKDRNL